MSRLEINNATQLSTVRLTGLIEEAIYGWAVGNVRVFIRYSRGADFSGSCYYGTQRIFINVGRHVKYPYRMGTHVARAVSTRRYWYKHIYSIELRDGVELAMFVFMHELYHLLVKRARRNTRQKESMCDRFATRYAVQQFGAVVRDEKLNPVPGEEWDFQDLERFVARARDRRVRAVRPLPSRPGIQLPLFGT